MMVETVQENNIKQTVVLFLKSEINMDIKTTKHFGLKA